MNLKSSVFFVLILLLSIPINGMQGQYLPYPFTQDAQSVPLAQLIHLRNFRVLFYFAIQHPEDKQRFSIINPNKPCDQPTEHLIHHAMVNQRIFPALVLNNKSFLVTNFEVIRKLEASLFRLKA